MTKPKARILLVDDHPIVRRGLAELIQRQPDLEICGEAEGVADAVQIIKAERPDLVVVDLSLKEGHGLDLIKDIRGRKNGPKILVVSMHEEASYAERALRAGAQGFLPKSEAIDRIIEAMRQILAGEVYLNRRMATYVLHGMVGGGPKLTKGPDEVL